MEKGEACKSFDGLSNEAEAEQLSLSSGSTAKEKEIRSPCLSVTGLHPSCHNPRWKMLHWNCQGLRNPLTIRYLKDITKKHKPDILFLTETKNGDSFVQSIGKQMLYDNQILVSAAGLSGGMAIFWKPTVSCTAVDQPNLYETNIMITEGATNYIVTYVYGNPVRSKRGEQWERMIDEHRRRIFKDGPRLLLGDFNDILNNDEKLGGPARSEASFRKFRDFVNVLGILDLPMEGSKFTWIGNRGGEMVRSRLDRAMANVSWLTTYPHAKTTALQWIGSDHKPLLVDMQSHRSTRWSLFRYDNRWRGDQRVHAVIKKAWEDRCQYYGPRNFHKALRHYRGSLSEWKRSNSTNSNRRLQEIQVLQDMQPRVTQAMNDSLIREVTEGEIWRAIRQMNVDKSPGVDGFNVGFYKYHWRDIGKDKWCCWIRTCLSTVSYSVLINGAPEGHITPQCGIRQGIPDAGKGAKVKPSFPCRGASLQSKPTRRRGAKLQVQS